MEEPGFRSPRPTLVSSGSVSVTVHVAWLCSPLQPPYGSLGLRGSLFPPALSQSGFSFHPQDTYGCLNEVLFLLLINLCICVCLREFMCTTGMHERVGSPGLELQAFVSCHVDSENQTRIFHKGSERS